MSFEKKTLIFAILELLIFPQFSFSDSIPIANAGLNQIVSEDTEVQLDGSSSLDGNEGSQKLSYSLTQQSGIPVVLKGDSTIKPKFQGPLLISNTPIFLSFSLRVENKNHESSRDIVYVAVFHNNKKPIANIKSPESCEVGTPVFLEGSESSDSDGDQLQYAWRQTEGIPVVLAGPTSGQAIFVCPALNEDLNSSEISFELTVEDSGYLISKASTTISVNNQFESSAQQMGWAPKQEEPTLLFKTISIRHEQYLREQINTAALTELESAKNLLAVENFSAAIKSSEKALTLNPSNEEIFNFRSKIHEAQKAPLSEQIKNCKEKFIQKDYLAVIRFAKQARSIDTNNLISPEFTNLALSALGTQSNAQFDQSLQNKKAIYAAIKNVDQSRKYYDEGLIFYVRGQLKEAAQSWKKSLRYDADNRLASNAYNRVIKEFTE